MTAARIITGDALTVLGSLESGSINCCVTSPPYFGLRDYGVDGQLGLELTPEEYVADLVAVFGEVRRLLRDDGTLWLNLGDSYTNGNTTNSTGGPSPRQMSNAGSWFEPRRIETGLRPKNLIGIPWRVAFALQADGWYLRSEIIWDKLNCMPESCKDRPTRAHETIFLLTKSPTYYYDADAIREPHGDMSRFCHPLGRNKRSVWRIPTQPVPEAHFATYPEKLVEPCILAGCPPRGVVLDPFAGSGTTGIVACRLGRDFVGIELNPEYAEMAERRIAPYRDQMHLDVSCSDASD